MKRLFLDTNVVLDLCIQSRKGYKLSHEIIKISIDRKQSLSIAWHTLSVLEYVGSKILKEEIFQVLQSAIDLFDIPATGSIEAQKAFQYLNGDYEDAMQIVSALSAGSNVIITADQSGGFDKSPIPVMTPISYLDYVAQE